MELPNKELHSLYHSPYIARVIKSRRLRWAANVTRIEEGRDVFKVLTGKLHEYSIEPLGSMSHEVS